MVGHRICIVILHNKNCVRTFECLDSLGNVAYSKLTILVIANSLNDNIIPKIRLKFPHVLISQSTFFGKANGYNIGLGWALSKPIQWIMLLSNEAIVSSDFLLEFMEQATKTPDAKILGANILHFKEPYTIDHAEILNDGKIRDSTVEESVSSKALLMHRDVPESIGLLEPRFHYFWEDLDFCYRARRKGFKIRSAPNAKVYFRLGDQDEVSEPYFWEKERLLWIERNFTPSERQNLSKTVIRPELGENLRDLIRLNFKTIISRILFHDKSSDTQKKIKFLREKLRGAIHYYLEKN